MTISFRVAGATLLLVFQAVAQATPAVPDPAAAVATPDPAVPQDAPTDLGRIERAGTTLRCFATAHSPVYDETLGEGDVVELAGEDQNGFVAVRLPLGVAGFVHKDFAIVGDDGVVRSKGTRVAFRYRTNSREAPVRFVTEGTEFRLLAADGDWLRVCAPQQVAWVPADAVVAFHGNATVEAAWHSFRARQLQAVEAASESRRVRAEAARELVATRERLVALSESTRQEMQRPDAEQDFATLQKDLATLADGLPPGSAELLETQRLTAEIERQVRALEMMRIVNEEPRIADPVLVTPAPERDPFGGAEVGWLRVRRPLFGAPSIQIEKGGQVLFELTCRSGRYALEIFDGMEVAVRGAQARADAVSMRTIDVAKLEILSRARR